MGSSTNAFIVKLFKQATATGKAGEKLMKADESAHCVKLCRCVSESLCHSLYLYTTGIYACCIHVSHICMYSA